MFGSRLTAALLGAASLLSAVAPASARQAGAYWRHLHPPNPDVDMEAAAAITGNATFQQLIDHKNPHLGTFSQFYYWSDQWYTPGGPVVLMTPGEINVTGYNSYLTLNRTTGVIAQKIGAAVIVIEHRYWGTSSPYKDLTTENMQYLTLDQSISDLTYFANNVKLPFDTARTSTPQKAPWVLVGGSYSGALSAWTEAIQPGIFWAYMASSAPVQSITDYWAYFAPVQQGMAQNCSTDVSRVVDYLDNIGANGTKAQQQTAKEMFGLGDVVHYDDFMSALENGPWLWQGNQFYSNTGFFAWCDAVEGVKKGDVLPGANGVGLQKALAGYASWFKNTLLPGFCASYGYADFQGDYNVKCFDTYNASSPIYTDTTLSNTVDRQWIWFICHEAFGWWQTGAPSSRPSIVSRLSNVQWNLRQCPLYFPGIKPYSAAHANAYTQGWNNRTSTRLLYTNGQFDPWREATVSSDFRPGGPLQSTAQTPVNIVPKGIHCSDLITRNGDVNAGVRAVQNAEVSQIAQWVSQFSKKSAPPSYGGGGKSWTA